MTRATVRSALRIFVGTNMGTVDLGGTVLLVTGRFPAPLGKKFIAF